MGGAVLFVGGMAGSWVRHFSRSAVSLSHLDMSSLSSGEHLMLGAGLSGKCAGDLVRLVSCVVVEGLFVMLGSGVRTVDVGMMFFIVAA